MRKIDKREILSKNYFTWIQKLKKDEHPTYNSSNNQYYFDVKMSLLYCQKGLCAYTEEVLCTPELIEKNNWDEIQYQRELTREEKGSVRGDLEHFDESLKENNAWLWENFFIVNTHNNCRIKHKKSVNTILKPDERDYDPFVYLEFDFETGIFIPNSHLSSDIKNEVDYMIKTLGLNCISYDRQRQLQEWKDRYDIGLPVKAYRFITAWEMTLKVLEGEK